jgi:hypothetical protein
MPLKQLNATLSDGQKVATLKRFRAKYQEELEKIEVEMQEIMISLAEADFMVQYIGEQPEVVEMRARKAELDTKEKRRQYLGKIIDRLDQCIPDQPDVKAPLPTGANAGRESGKAPVRRY